MSKNIAIISTYDWIKKANNYGSLFQYYALQEYLKQLGYNPYWVKYFPNHNNKNKNLYKTLISIVKRFLNKTLYYVHNNKVNICTKSFNKFILDYLNTSQYEYESWESLKA